MMMEAQEILAKYKIFAVVGVSQNKEKYGYEVFEILVRAGYSVYPINPKYDVVDGHRCYASLRDLPERPDVVVALVPPALTEKVVETCVELQVPVVWMPPGAWSEVAVSRCRESHLRVIHDICIVFALKSLPYAKA